MQRQFGHCSEVEADTKAAIRKLEAVESKQTMAEALAEKTSTNIWGRFDMHEKK